MIEQDTIKLLRECDAGIQMGVDSIDDVLNRVRAEKMRECLSKCKKEHQELDAEVQALLEKYRDDGKDPNPMAKGMSWMKTTMKMAMDESDATIADLMVDGCDMGVKSLSRYLNQYAAADEVSKDICKRLIKLEEKLGTQMRDYL
ncbi:MAG: hypothetical protein IJN04_04610 [Clostridia bacterium]|nr:hypothetical protein [Clostridia bacterium]